MNRIYTFVIITLCKSLHLLMRLLGRNGEALPGMLALKLYPGILSRMAEGMHCVCVTGTNGKTTTVQMLSKLMNERYGEDLMKILWASTCLRASHSSLSAIPTSSAG